jgi:hypothetical protein
MWGNKQGTVTLQSLLARAEVLFSLVSVRSVVNFFFAAGEEDDHERHNAAQPQPKADSSLRRASRSPRRDMSS